MNSKLFSAIALSLAALSAGSAFAAQPTVAVSRDQVLAELAEAQRTGDIVEVHGATMKKLNEFYPADYPAKVAAAGKTREQVSAELIEAQRSGDIVVVRGSTMKKLNEFDPGNYPATVAGAAPAGEHVFAELGGAKRVESL